MKLTASGRFTGVARSWELEQLEESNGSWQQNLGTIEPKIHQRNHQGLTFHKFPNLGQVDFADVVFQCTARSALKSLNILQVSSDLGQKIDQPKIQSLITMFPNYP